MAIAALDIIELNPHTRVPNTSFGSLEALRNWIKFYIKSKAGGSFAAPAGASKQDRSSSVANGELPASKKSAQKSQFYLQQRANRASVGQTVNPRSMEPKCQTSKNNKLA
jgi:hypothetical protein